MLKRAFVSICYIAGIVTLGVGAAACSQGEGERCQVESDCESGLICCVRDNTDDRIVGGVCTEPNRCELDFTDASVNDTPTTDAAVDATAASDEDAAATEDAAAEDDATTEDAAATATADDAGVLSDGGADDATLDDASDDGSVDDAEVTDDATVD